MNTSKDQTGLISQAAIGPNTANWVEGSNLGDHNLGMFLTEVWVTFVFLSVICGVKYHSAAKDLQLNALMIGLTLSANILISANTTGASLNPAVGIVLPLFSYVTRTDYQWL